MLQIEQWQALAGLIAGSVGLPIRSWFPRGDLFVAHHKGDTGNDTKINGDRSSMGSFLSEGSFSMDVDVDQNAPALVREWIAAKKRQGDYLFTPHSVRDPELLRYHFRDENGMTPRIEDLYTGVKIYLRKLPDGTLFFDYPGFFMDGYSPPGSARLAAAFLERQRELVGVVREHDLTFSKARGVTSKLESGSPVDFPEMMREVIEGVRALNGGVSEWDPSAEDPDLVLEDEDGTVKIAKGLEELVAKRKQEAQTRGYEYSGREARMTRSPLCGGSLRDGQGVTPCEKESKKALGEDGKLLAIYTGKVRPDASSAVPGVWPDAQPKLVTEVQAVAKTNTGIDPPTLRVNSLVVVDVSEVANSSHFCCYYIEKRRLGVFFLLDPLFTVSHVQVFSRVCFSFHSRFYHVHYVFGFCFLGVFVTLSRLISFPVFLLLGCKISTSFHLSARLGECRPLSVSHSSFRPLFLWENLDHHHSRPSFSIFSNLCHGGGGGGVFFLVVPRREV